MLDVLYVVSGVQSDQRLFKRLKCSVDSVLKNDYEGINICICDTSPVSLETELRKHLKCGFSYLFQEAEGDYNKSFNINLAVKELSKFEHIMVTDLDMVFDRMHIQNCFLLMEEFPIVTYVTHALKTEFYSSSFAELRKRDGDRIAIGGGFFARKGAFMRLNGFDEAYFGWGGEDSDFYNRAEQLFEIQRPCEEITVVHLWHEENDRNRLVNENRNYHRCVERAELVRSGQIAPWDIKSYLAQ